MASITGRISLSMPRNGIPTECSIILGDDALGRVNGRWRKVTVDRFDTDTINGRVVPVTVGIWQTEGSLIWTKKRFMPTIDKDLMPDNQQTRAFLRSLGEKIIA